jgi:dienelactone hydrolase
LESLEDMMKKIFVPLAVISFLLIIPFSALGNQGIEGRLVAHLLAMSSAAAADEKIVGKVVTYSAEGVTMKGYLAYDAGIKGKRPGVLVVHEWWGHNEYARKRARMLAALGYTALAVDMYGNGKQATHPEDAGTFSSELFKHFDTAKDRFLAALEFLKKQKTVDTQKIAAIGYCFGGGIVLNMARQGVDLKGVVSFHGSLAAVEPAKPGAIKARILVLHGAADKFTTKEQVESFQQEMKNAGADFQFISYPGAIHSFTNPDADKYARKFNLPLGYNAQADKKSWDEMQRFFDVIFK